MAKEGNGNGCGKDTLFCTTTIEADTDCLAWLPSCVIVVSLSIRCHDGVHKECKYDFLFTIILPLNCLL